MAQIMIHQGFDYALHCLPVRSWLPATGRPGGRFWPGTSGLLLAGQSHVSVTCDSAGRCLCIMKRLWYAVKRITPCVSVQVRRASAAVTSCAADSGGGSQVRHHTVGGPVGGARRGWRPAGAFAAAAALVRAAAPTSQVTRSAGLQSHPHRTLSIQSLSCVGLRS